MDSSLLGMVFRLGAVLGLVLLNGFFVAAEFSLVTVRRSRVEQLLNEGRRGAPLVAGILKDLDTVISSTQLGITMASLALGWVGEPFLAHLFEPWLAFLPASAVLPTAHSLAVALAFALITFLHIVLGELAPKSMALQRPEGVSLAVAPPMTVFARLFRPFIVVLNGSGNLVLRLVGIKGPSGHQLVHSEEELRILLAESEESGVLEQQETEIIQRVFDFTDMTARQVMIPRTEMACIPVDATLDEAVQVVLRENYTRFPVYQDGLDDIVGVVHVKDIMRAVCGKDEATFDVRAIMRNPLIVPEMIHVDDLLSQFRRHRSHVAILVDEFGGTAGLVTLQDLLEEIVGDLADEFEGNELRIEPQADGTSLVNGKILIEDVNERLNLALEDPNYVTLGGLVFSQLGRRPRGGDEVGVRGARLRVEHVDGLRVASVRVIPEHTPDVAMNSESAR